MDESGLSTVQQPQKGKLQVDVLTSAERGQYVTHAACANVAKNVVPPIMTILKKSC